MDIRAAVDKNLALLPTSGSQNLFREWIFPNSLKFPCSGLLTGWIFRADNIIITSKNNLPLWVVYYRITATNQLSFNLREGSGSIAGVTKIADGVYQYSLQSPVQVEEGDVVGIQYQEYPLPRTKPLHLLFTNGGSGINGPVSYWRPSNGTLFLVGSSSGDLAQFVSPHTRYTPLVTAVMSKYLNNKISDIYKY